MIFQHPCSSVYYDNLNYFKYWFIYAQNIFTCNFFIQYVLNTYTIYIWRLINSGGMQFCLIIIWNDSVHFQYSENHCSFSGDLYYLQMTTTDVHYERDRQHNSSCLIITETNINGKTVLCKKCVFFPVLLWETFFTLISTFNCIQNTCTNAQFWI